MGDHSCRAYSGLSINAGVSLRPPGRPLDTRLASCRPSRGVFCGSGQSYCSVFRAWVSPLQSGAAGPRPLSGERGSGKGWTRLSLLQRPSEAGGDCDLIASRGRPCPGNPRLCPQEGRAAQGTGATRFVPPAGAVPRGALLGAPDSTLEGEAAWCLPTGDVATAGSSRTLTSCVQPSLPWFPTCHLGLSLELPHRPLCRWNEPMVVELLEGWALGTYQQLLLGACSRRGPAVGTRILIPLGPHGCPTGGGSYLASGG